MFLPPTLECKIGTVQFIVKKSQDYYKNGHEMDNLHKNFLGGLSPLTPDTLRPPPGAQPPNPLIRELCIIISFVL